MACKGCRPVIFDEFFSSDLSDVLSPFLKKSSRKWAKNLSLRLSILSAFILFLSFILPSYSLFFLSFVYLVSGTPALIQSLKNIENLEINIDVLMTLAALLAVFIGSATEGALLLVLFEFSGAMEELVSDKTKGAVFALKKLSPQFGHVLLPNGRVVQQSVREIPVGAHLVIRAGDVVALDGIVISGSSSLNLVHLTGEAAPISKHEGDEVPAGAINGEGTLTLRVEKTSSDSTLARIIRLVTDASAARPKAQRFLDRFGKIYAPCIIFLSLFFALFFHLYEGLPLLGKGGSVYRALAFLIAASPCALIIATPTAYLSALSACAKKGILVKGGVVLDALNHIKNIAFDKTGTLTTGELTCTKITPYGSGAFNVEEALKAAAALEAKSNHPISKALSFMQKEKNLQLPELKNFKSEPGFGLMGEIIFPGKKPVEAFIGRKSFVVKKLAPNKKEIENLPEGTWLNLDGSLFLFEFEDTLRENLKELFVKLKAMQLGHVMLTGDHFASAERVAQVLGIEEFFAGMTPKQKLEKVIELSKRGDLAMVGDGVNDAPSLARASVGISMGEMASGPAIEAADVIFLHDDIGEMAWLLQKARKTVRLVKQNLGLALLVILFATTPALLGLVPLWMAVVLHEGGTVIVGLNSLRLLRK